MLVVHRKSEQYWGSCWLMRRERFDESGYRLLLDLEYLIVKDSVDIVVTLKDVGRWVGFFVAEGFYGHFFHLFLEFLKLARKLVLFLSSEHDFLNLDNVLLEVFLSKLLDRDLFAFELLLADQFLDCDPVLVLDGLTRDVFDHRQFLTEFLKLATYHDRHLGDFVVFFVKLFEKIGKRKDVVVHS